MCNLQIISKNLDWYNRLKGDETRKEYLGKAVENIEDEIEKLPSGSGLDDGIRLNYELSKPERLVFYFSYHRMDEHGGYDGWTAHQIIITPSLQNQFNTRITGRDRNYTKEYLYDLFADYFTV